MTSPGKPAPDPRSSQSSRLRRKVAYLGRIGEMPGPQAGQGGGSDEIGGFLPMGEQFGVPLKPVDCFTWNFKDFGEIPRACDGGRPLAA